MNKKHFFIGVYDYTVIATYLSFFATMLGLFFAMNNLLNISAICLMVSGMLDMFDGPIARTKTRGEEEKSYGIQIDSLCDLVCFGVFPAILVYQSSQKSLWLAAVLIIYALCAMIRLAYFNVTEIIRSSEEACPRKKYTGLPVTISAIAVPIFLSIKSIFNIETDWLLFAVMLLIAFMFVSPFRITKPKVLGKVIMIIIGIAELVFLVVNSI